MQTFMPAVAGLVVATLTGCASQPASMQPTSSTQGSTLVEQGQITDVRDISFNDGRHSVAGSVIGAVLGGIAGSHIGAGNGRALVAAGGAATGALAGRQLGSAASNKRLIRLSVRTADGMVTTYDVESSEAFHVGDSVKVITANGKVSVTH